MINAKVSLGRLGALLQQAPDTARPVMQAMLRDNARLLISSSGGTPGMVQVTPPSQGKANMNAKRTGETAVMRDIYRVYTTPGEVYKLMQSIDPRAASAFWLHIKKKNWRAAQSVLDRVPSLPSYARTLRPFDDGIAHRARRNNLGRVKGKTPSMLVANAAWVKNYIRQKQKLVGLMAAAIPAGYNGRFGPLKGVPTWIARHSSSFVPGYVVERLNNRSHIILLGMNGAALNSELQRRFNYVLGYRVRAMNRQLPYVAQQIETRLAARLTHA